MKFSKFIASLFLIYETSIYLVIGQVLNKDDNDCTKLYNFLYGNSRNPNNCCNSHSGVECDDKGYITYYNNMYDPRITIDIPSFPYLPKIEYLNIQNQNINEIPNSILKLTSLKRLILNGNKIEIIPPTIQNLSNLIFLQLDGNKIKELPDEIFNLPNLVSLEFRENNIEVIPPAIQHLSKLKNFDISDNDIKELPNVIYNLPLDRLIIISNPNLKTNLINFGNTPIGICYFHSINILCYEAHTCETIYLSYEKEITDADAEKYLKICSKEEINDTLNPKEIKNSLSQDNNKNKNLYHNKKSNSSFIVKTCIIIGCIISVSIGIFVTFMLIKKRRSKKKNKSYFNLDDKIRTENFVKNNQINNNNTIHGIHNNNKSNSINKSNTPQSNINPNNSVMVTLNDMIKDIHRGGSYSSYSSYEFSSFSL